MKDGPFSSNILLSLGTFDMAIRFYKDDIIHLSAPSGPHKTSALRDPTHPNPSNHPHADLSVQNHSMLQNR